MLTSYQRDYLLRLPLPLAQLYRRAHDAKDARTRHDNYFYLCESLVKLAAAPAIACYLHEIQTGQPRATAIDRLLVQLALPSLGQWRDILRELSRHFGSRVDAQRHPLGHLYEQLTRPRKDLPGLLALYQRIKNGPDGKPAADDRSCSVLQLLDALVQYRNLVFGHGGPRFETFFEKDMGPLLLPAVNELVAENVVDWFGPPGTRLVYLTEIRKVDDAQSEIGLREWLGLYSERSAPLRLSAEQTDGLLANRVALLWPGRPVPLRLDPLLVYRESDQGEDVLFLNRDRNGRQVEYLSYISGKTEREASMAMALAALLSVAAGRTVTEEQLAEFQAQSAAATPSVEMLTGEQPLAGQVLGDYELLGVLGRGGMGVVYLARQLSLGRLVALKTLPADLGGDEVALARLRREIRALGRCDHPHVVKVLTSGVLPDGQPYYMMEYVPGCDLERVWQELSTASGIAAQLSGSSWRRAVLTASKKQREQALEQLPPLPELPPLEDDPRGYARRVVLLMRDAARAVQAVHEQNLIHRDVKPANLMLTPDGERVVLMDFGLAKGYTASPALSKGGGLLGTLRYAAPEQLAAANLKVGPEADVRGLGVTLWELLTRRRLFAEAADEKQLAQMVHDNDVPRLRSVEPSLDRDLEAIVGRATERRVADRIAKAGQLADYLQLWLDGRPLPIRTPGVGELLRRWVLAHKPLVASTTAVLLVLLLAASSIGWALWDRAAKDTERRAELASRMAETEKAVTVALTKAQQSEDRAKQMPCTTSVEAKASLVEWKEAVASLAEADAALTTGAATDDLRERVADVRQRIASGQRQTQRKENLFRGVDDARLATAISADGNFNYAGAAAKYAAAFAEFGIKVQPGQTEVFAKRIRSEEPAVRDVLILALDHWAFCERKAHVYTADLLEIASAADQDAWRRDYRQAVVERDSKALVRLSMEARSGTLQSTSLHLLALALLANDRREEALDLLRWARGHYSNDFWIAFYLGFFLGEAEISDPLSLEEQIGCYRVAVALRHEASTPHYYLGRALEQKKQIDDAIAEFRKAIALDTKYAPFHGILGNALRDKNQLDDAIAEYNKAIALDPNHALIHLFLGITLYEKNKLDDAITEFNTAIALDPKGSAHAHNGLGVALRAKKDLDDAIAEFNKAIALDPKFAKAHYNLGLALEEKNQLDDAIAEFKKAILLDPNDAPAHVNLGFALYAKKQLDDAIAEFKKAILLDPKNASAHHDLGLFLHAKKELDDAIAEFNKAIALDPKDALAHWSLGLTLQEEGRFAEAKTSCQNALDLLPEKHPLRPDILQKRDECSAFLALEAKLPDILAGKAQPKDNGQRLAFVDICIYQKRYAAAAKLYSNGFTVDAKFAEMKLAGDPNTSHRYNAACCAALAGSGQGKDADKLTDQERADLRKQALQWLRADLVAWGKQLDKDADKARPVVQGKMTHWKQDTDLTGVRDPKALEKLPPDERDTWQKLWQDVDALLAKTQEKE